jgi:hypothetical protein
MNDDLALRVERRAAIATIKRRAQRFRRFRSVPVALFFFCVFVAAIITRRGGVLDAYLFERKCVGAPARACAARVGRHCCGGGGGGFITSLPPPPSFPGSLTLNVLGGNEGVRVPTTLATYLGTIATGPDATTGELTGVLPAAFAALAPGSVLEQGRLPGGGVILGGIVLAQTRRAAVNCSALPALGSLGAFVSAAAAPAGLCYGAPSLAPFGPNFTACAGGGGALPDAAGCDAVAAFPDLPRAFRASYPRGAPGGAPAFRAFFSAYDALTTLGAFPVPSPAPVDYGSAASLAALLGARWVDDATAALELSFAAAHPSLGRVAWVSYGIDAALGGLATYTTSATSFQTDPYGAGAPAPGLTRAFDVLVVLYTAYVCVSALRRALRVCLAARAEGARRAGAAPVAAREKRRIAAAHAATCPAACARDSLSVTSLVDWGAAAALAAAVATWALHVASLGALAAALAATPRVFPSLRAGLGDDDEAAYYYANPAYVAGPGSVPSQAPPWGAVEAAARGAAASFWAFEIAAQAALLMLALRFFKYLSFQAHLGVVMSTLARASRDLLHFSASFGFAAAAFAVWGYFAWGHAAPEWSTPGLCVVTFFKFLMYDMDLPATVAADAASGGALAYTWYTLFMMLMTNVMLWLFFASLFDTYSVERLRALEWPTLVMESRAFAAAAPYMLPAALARALPRARAAAAAACAGARGGSGACCARGAGARAPAPPAPPRAFVTWGELLREAERDGGRLRALRFITPADLVAVFGLEPAAAALTVADLMGAAAAAAAARTGIRDEAAKVAADAKLDVAEGFYGFDFPGGPHLPARAAAGVVAAFPALAARAPRAPADDAADDFEAKTPSVAGALASSLRAVLRGGGGGGASPRPPPVAEAAAAAVPPPPGPPPPLQQPPTPPRPAAAEDPTPRGAAGAADDGEPRVSVNPLASGGGGGGGKYGGAPAPAAAYVDARALAAATAASPFAAYDVYRAPPVSAYDAAEFRGGAGGEAAEEGARAPAPAPARGAAPSPPPAPSHDDIVRYLREHALANRHRYGDEEEEEAEEAGGDGRWRG